MVKKNRPGGKRSRIQSLKRSMPTAGGLGQVIVLFFGLCLMLIGQDCYGAIAGSTEFAAKALTPMPLKGKKQPVLVYEVSSTMASSRAAAPPARFASSAPSAS